MSLNRLVFTYVALLSVLIVVISGYTLRQSDTVDGSVASTDDHSFLASSSNDKFHPQFEHQDKRFETLSENSLEERDTDKRGRPMPPLPWDKRAMMYRQLRGRAMPPLPWDKRSEMNLEEQLSNLDESGLQALQNALNARRLALRNID